MEHIGAGLAALGVFGPGLGLGTLAGLSATATGGNPAPAGHVPRSACRPLCLPGTSAPRCSPTSSGRMIS